MKLLITLDFPPEVGGIQNYLLEIAKNLYTKDDFILSCGKYEVLDKSLNPTVLRVIKLPNKKNSLFIMAPILLKKILQKNITIIECGNVYAALLPWFLSFFKKINYSVYTYGTELLPLRNKSLKSSILKSTLNRASKINVLLESQKKLLNTVTTNKNIDIIPPKITLTNKWIKKNKKQDSLLKIITVGRLVKHKGHEFLINAISKLQIDFHLTIIGSGPELNNIKKLITKLSLQKKIEVLSNISDKQLNNYYNNSDLFILPSIKLESGCEGFGIVLLEAMSHSIPIIASNSGGISEVLGYGKFGRLFKPGDIEDLNRVIKEFTNDLDSNNEITKKAFKHLEENYVWK